MPRRPLAPAPVYYDMHDGQGALATVGAERVARFDAWCQWCGLSPPEAYHAANEEAYKQDSLGNFKAAAEWFEVSAAGRVAVAHRFYGGFPDTRDGRGHHHAANVAMNEANRTSQAHQAQLAATQGFAGMSVDAPWQIEQEKRREAEQAHRAQRQAEREQDAELERQAQHRARQAQLEAQLAWEAEQAHRAQCEFLCELQSQAELQAQLEISALALHVCQLAQQHMFGVTPFESF